MVPREYSNEYIVSRETPYHVADEPGKAPQSPTGTLDIGRVVWTTKPLPDISPDEKIAAYAAGVGPIELDPKTLKTF